MGAPDASFPAAVSVDGNLPAERLVQRDVTGSPHKIAVFRALQWGDMLCAIPALRALRTAYPKSEITLIGLPWARTFSERYHQYIDRFLEFPGYPGLPESPAQIDKFPRFLESAQKQKFDLAIQLHGSGRLVNSVVGLLGAKHQAGFYMPNDFCPDPSRFMPYPNNLHEIVRLTSLMTFLGIALQGNGIDFPVTRADQVALGAIPEIRQFRLRNYVCIHAGARWPSRRWLPERFAQVADHLADEGLQIVLTGSGEEASLVQRVSRSIRAPHLNVAGRTTMGALGALVAKARLVVCNDTGISHVAAALRIPSVVIVLGSDPVRWGPLDASRHRLIQFPVSCRPCEHRDCPIGHPCADGVSVRRVVSEARSLLELSYSSTC